MTSRFQNYPWVTNLTKILRRKRGKQGVYFLMTSTIYCSKLKQQYYSSTDRKTDRQDKLFWIKNPYFIPGYRDADALTKFTLYCLCSCSNGIVQKFVEFDFLWLPFGIIISASGSVLIFVCCNLGSDNIGMGNLWNA